MSTSPLRRALGAAAAAPVPVATLWVLLVLTGIGATADIARGGEPGTALFAVATVALVVHVVARALGHQPWPWSDGAVRGD